MEINDEYIINEFINKNGKPSCIKFNNKWINNHLDIKNYLDNRFSDSLSYIETIYRIKHNIEIRPTCHECGRPVNFNTYSTGFRNFCSTKCARKNKETIEKYHQTCINKYGVNSFYQSDIFKNKSKITCMKKYGVDNYSKTEEFKKRYEQICLERYGVKNTFLLEKSRLTCLEKYGFIYASQSEEIKEKIKLTCLEKYGVEYSFQSENNKIKSKQTKLLKYGNEYYTNSEKYKLTCLEKYGVDNYAKTVEFKQKYQQTCIEKYGVPSTFQYDYFKELAKYTNLEKYGVDIPTKSSLIKEKIKQTNILKYNCPTIFQSEIFQIKSKNSCLLKYGVESYSQTDEYKQKQSKLMSSKEMQERRNAIQKEHHTFNSSKIEQQFKEYLEQNYPNDFEYQYRSEPYPFNCDFYIKSLDLYIEIQGSWTHGRHPFDENNQDDIDKLNLWKSKNTKYYNVAIKVWSDLDVRKRTIAKENKINYLEIFSNNIYKCIEALNNYLN